MSSTLPPDSFLEGQPHRVTNPRARIALAQSVLSHRPATFETIALAIRALEGEDLIATGAK